MAKKESKKVSKSSSSKKAVATTGSRGKTSRLSKLEKRVARCEKKGPKKALPCTVQILRTQGEVVYDGFLVKVDEKTGTVEFRRKKTNASAKMLTETFRFADVVELFGAPGKASQITVSVRDAVVREIPNATVKQGNGFVVVTDEHGDQSHIFECQGYTVRQIGTAEG